MSMEHIQTDLFHVQADQIVFDATNMSIPAAQIGNTHIAALAGVEASKLKHRHRPTYSQPNTTATTETRGVHVAKAAGTVNSFQAGSIAICAGAATITVDLKKNGASILSAVITLNSGNTNRVAVAGTISSAAYVAGDMFEIVITATAGGGTIGTGFFCTPEFDEAAA